ncbi:aldehyde dehydrogenase family protein [Vallitalea okinawensis]|uniref:aldehyde dehydrogenase family protein n=1 Tax=Vallitalea okinawensis TaxID=2078660 RepID=UPI002E8E4473|nr:aldehyde dehydrogenase family protein [Vallitalea okinawensis]
MNLDKELMILREMNDYFHTGETRSIEFRIKQLKILREAVRKYEDRITTAIQKDLGRPKIESYEIEVGCVLDSLNYIIKNLKKWSKVKKVKTPLHLYRSKSYIKPEPYGIAYIIGPFNYPFNLCIEPLIGAISAGNCSVITPSEQTPAITKVIKELISENFSNRYIRVVEGGKEEITRLIHSPFDYIFFTGSVPVGKIIMEAASKNLIPVTLELGGKSPCIIDKDANIKVAAERIAWGKFFNAGQTCVAPDYLLVHESIKAEFIDEMKKTIRRFYGSDIKKSKDLTRIVNERHTNRLISIIDKDKDKIIFGGNYDLKDHYIEPTLIDNVCWEDESMLDEIFGPILPIMPFTNIDSVINMLHDRPKPLALYIFTENKKLQTKVLEETSSGGSCVNEVVNHFVNPRLPFGGVGNSGMSAYHGELSFKVFSHMKSVLNRSISFRMTLTLPPYNSKKYKLVKKLLK